MSQIPNEQGAVKASEISVDSAQPLLATSERENVDTVLTKIGHVLTDALKRSAGGVLLTTRNTVAANPGSIAWTGSQLIFGVNTDVVIRLIQNESGQMVQLKANYGAVNGTNTFNTVPLTSGEVLYVELDRSLIPSSGDLVLENAVSGGSFVAGKTIKKATSGPALADVMSGPSGTLSIPLAINVDGHLWWIPHGIYWPPNTSSPIGAVITSTSLPIGAMVPFHTFGSPSPLGYSALKLAAPGFHLCDGSVIIDPQSPHFNPTRNADGTPSLSYNPALDKFAPNVNGAHETHNSANSYSEGDYVQSGGTNYVAIQAAPPGILITNTSYWVPESTYNNTSASNPYNKYRKTTQNQGNSTYIKGSASSLPAESASAYDGSNTHTLTSNEIPGHSHTFSATTGNESNDHTHSGLTDDDSPDHTHGYYVQLQWFGGYVQSAGDGGVWNGQGNASTGGASNRHKHTFTTYGRSATHTHSVSGTSDSTGGSQPHNNEPRNFKSIYIVRIY